MKQVGYVIKQSSKRTEMPLFNAPQLINAVAVTTTVGDALDWLNVSKYFGSVLGDFVLKPLITKLQTETPYLIVQGVNVLCVG